MDKGTHSFHMERVVYLDPKEAHKTLLERTWWQVPWWSEVPIIAPLVKLRDQKDEAGNGALRGVPGGLHEEILDAKLGEYIEYSVVRKLWFPASYHRGRISFYQAGPGCTRVTWDLSYTPRIYGPLLIPIMWTILGFMFDDYAKFANKKHTKQSNPLWGLVRLFFAAYLVFIISRLMRLPNKPSYPGTDYLNALEQHRQATAELSTVVSKYTYLVIGGTGFTGSAVVHDLRKRGAKKVKIMGRNFPPVVQYPYGPNKEDMYPLPGVEYVRGDLTDPASLREALKGVDVVFQTAVDYGLPNFGMMRGGERAERINVGGMKNLYAAAKESKTVKQIIYTSSVDTVFTHEHLHHVNETHPYAALGDNESTYARGKWAVGDHYARTKIMAEEWLLQQDKKDGIRTLSLRPNAIIGPGENIFIKSAVDVPFLIGILPFYFDTTTKHDASCVSNLAYSHILASYKLATNPDVAGGKAYFITNGDVSNIGDLSIVKSVIEAAGGPVKFWFKVPSSVALASGWAMEWVDNFAFNNFGFGVPPFLTWKMVLKLVRGHHFDISRAKKDLGYEPFMTTEQCNVYVAEEAMRRYGWTK